MEANGGSNTVLTSSRSESTLDLVSITNISIGGGEGLQKRTREWEAQADTADKMQSELFHKQWALFREQVSTFSRELIVVRKHLQDLQLHCETETHVRSEINMKVDVAVSTIEELGRNLQQETKSRVEMKEVLSRDIANFDENARKHASDLAHEQATNLAEAIASERNERKKDDDSMRDEFRKFREQFVDEKALNHARNQELDANLQRVCVELDEEKRGRLADVNDLAAKLNALDAKIDATAALLDPIRADILRETETRKQEIHTVTNSVSELSSDLQQEKEMRAKGDEQLAKEINQLKAMLEKEKDERCAQANALREELSGELRRIVAELAEIRKELHALDGRADERLHTQCKILSSDIAKLRATIDSEIQARTSTDENVNKAEQDVALATQRLEGIVDKNHKDVEARLDQETSERRGSEDRIDHEWRAAIAETNKAVQDNKGDIDQERKLRAQGDADLRIVISTTTDELAQEKALRSDTDAAIRKDLQTLGEQVAKNATDLRGQLEDEAQRRAAGDEGLASRVAENKNRLEAEAAARAKGDDENNKNLQSLRQDFTGAVSSITGNHEDLSQAVKALQEKASAEQGAREQGDKDLSGAVKDLGDRIDQEEARRIDADKALDKVDQDLKSRLEAEIAERRKNDADTEVKLDNEIAQRVGGDAALKAGYEDAIKREVTELNRLLSEVSNRIDVESNDRGNGDDNLSESLKQLRVELEKEKKQRAEQDSIFAAELDAAHLNHETEAQSRRNGEIAMSQGFQQLMNHAGTESSRPKITRNVTPLVTNVNTGKGPGSLLRAAPAS